jgi:para-nitrobenzyl esterase
MSTVIKTRYGKVRGSVADGVSTFKGIPYAAPPSGINRLLPPQPVAPWSDVRDALTYGPTPPKSPIPPDILAILPELTIPGEDYLNLNIWSPYPKSSKRPVMVWIPGGMFEYGTAATAWYDGSRFARDGIICVTINYRIGAEGFLYLGEGSSNRGLLDQVAALQWVKENIAAFGGDPGNVTIFGESAGAMSVGTLLSMPCAEGLFHRAIAQSGGAHNAISVAAARQVGQRLCEKLGVKMTREAIAAVSIDNLLAAQAELRTDLLANPDPRRWGAEVVSAMLPWQPVVDGDVIPAPPFDRIASGVGAGVDLMVGSNTDEHRLFMATSDAIYKVTTEALTGAVAAYGLPVEESLTAYRSLHPGASAGDLLAAVITDWYWRIPSLLLADAHVRGGSATFMYEFAWRSPQFDGRLGACHALEIPFVFGTLGKRTEPFQGTNPPQQLADIMHAAWVSFATRGDPGWPKYDLTRRATMHFDTKSRIVDDPLSIERRLWKGLR